MKAVTDLCEALMRAVVASGAIRVQDCGVATKIMREELKAFLSGERYAHERAIALTGRHQLAFASLAATCVTRILQERE